LTIFSQQLQFGVGSVELTLGFFEEGVAPFIKSQGLVQGHGPALQPAYNLFHPGDKLLESW